jgi:hypothetical protein
MRNEASAARETLATREQHGLRRSCGRVSDITLEPSSTRRVFVAGCAGNAETTKFDVKEQSANRDGKSKTHLVLHLVCLTVCVTGAGAGVDSAWEQRKLEARKMLEKRAESPASSARGVGWLFV